MYTRAPCYPELMKHNRNTNNSTSTKGVVWGEPILCSQSNTSASISISCRLWTDIEYYQLNEPLISFIPPETGVPPLHKTTLSSMKNSWFGQVVLNTGGPSHRLDFSVQPVFETTCITLVSVVCDHVFNYWEYGLHCVVMPPPLTMPAVFKYTHL